MENRTSLFIILMFTCPILSLQVYGFNLLPRTVVNDSCHCVNDTVCINVPSFSLHLLCTPQVGYYFSYDPGIDITTRTDYDPNVAGLGKHEIYHIINGTDTCYVFTITVKDLPNDADTISGSRTACYGDTKRYSVIPVQNADYYEWSFTGGVLPNPDSTHLFIDIKFFNSGWLRVRGVNNCAKGNFSYSIPITVSERPVPIIKEAKSNLSLPDSICQNSIRTYTVDGNFSSYAWLPFHGTSPILNQKEITVLWDTLPTNAADRYGHLCVTVTGLNNTCPGVSCDSIFIKNMTSPEPSTIWQFGCDMLVCSDSTALRYTWYKNGNIFEGKSGRYIIDTLNQSSYTVKTCSDTAGICCNISAPYNKKKSGCDETAATLRVSPNPAHDRIEVKISPANTPAGHILLFNQYGSLVFEQMVTSGDFQIDLSPFPRGLYFLEYLGGNRGKLTSKIIKL